MPVHSASINVLLNGNKCCACSDNWTAWRCALSNHQRTTPSANCLGAIIGFLSKHLLKPTCCELQKQLPNHSKHLRSHHSLWPLLSWKWEKCKTCSAFCKKLLPKYTTKNMPTYLHTNTYIYLHTLMHRHIDTVMYHLLFMQVSGCNFGAFLLGPSLQSVAMVLVFDEDCDASSGTGRGCQQAGLKGFLKH